MEGIAMWIFEKQRVTQNLFYSQIWEKILFKLSPLVVEHKCTLLMKLFITAFNISGLFLLISRTIFSFNSCCVLSLSMLCFPFKYQKSSGLRSGDLSGHGTSPKRKLFLKAVSFMRHPVYAYSERILIIQHLICKNMHILMNSSDSQV